MRLTCGLENDPSHVHSDGCYSYVNTGVLICGQTERAADPGHVHTEDCYEHVWQLSCGQTERAADPGHTHSEDCYEHEYQLTCGLEENDYDPGHVHTSSCYVQEKVLVCEQKESWYPHVHTVDCFEKDDFGNPIGDPICGMDVLYEHVHNADCFPQLVTVQTCTLPEHIHTNDCYLPDSAQLYPQTQFVSGQEGNYFYDPEDLSTQGNDQNPAGEQQDYGQDTLNSDLKPSFDGDDNSNNNNSNVDNDVDESLKPVFGGAQDNSNLTPSFSTDENDENLKPVFDGAQNVSDSLSSDNDTVNVDQNNAGLNPVQDNGQEDKELSTAGGEQNGSDAAGLNGSADGSGDKAQDENKSDFSRAVENLVFGSTGSESETEADEGNNLTDDNDQLSDTTVAMKDALARIQSGADGNQTHLDLDDENPEEKDDRNLSAAVDALKTGSTEGSDADSDSSNVSEIVYVNAGYTVRKDISDLNVQESGIVVPSEWVGVVSMETGLFEEPEEYTGNVRNVSYALGNNIAGFGSAGGADESGYVWTAADTGAVINVNPDQLLRFRIVFDLPAGTLGADNRTLIYHVPDQIRSLIEEGGEILDESGNLVAEYRTYSQGGIAVTFTEEAAANNAADTAYSVAISFTTAVSDLAWEEAAV
jgi:hypothetical protein